MTLGEICILTDDVVRLANFYRDLLGIDNKSDDAVHQAIIAEETMLTISNDSSGRKASSPNMCIAFTCDDVNAEYRRLVEMKAEIIEKPQNRPWGTVRSMSFHDPDGNVVYLRTFLNKENKFENITGKNKKHKSQPRIYNGPFEDFHSS